MSDDTLVILMCFGGAMAAYIVYLKLIVVRGLRKKIDRLIEPAVTAPAHRMPLALPDNDSGELATIKQRLQVLERIAVEKEDSLDRQFDELRSAQG